MTRKARNIALDLRDISFMENYRWQVSHGVIRYAQEHPDWRLLFNLECFSLTDRFDSYEELVPLGVDGLITMHKHEMPKLRQLGIPAVCLSGPDPGVEFPCVLSDNIAVGREAAGHFLERGFRHFAISVSSDLPWEIERATGFRDAVAAAGCSCDSFSYSYALSDEPSLVRRQRHQVIAGRLTEWLGRQPRPLGLFATCDTRAFQAVETCQELGLRVPQDVAVVGVDNNAVTCSAIKPSLSSVEPNAARVGFEAAELLDRLMTGKALGAPQRIVIPPKGVVMRMSSDVLAVEDTVVADALKFIASQIAETISMDDVAAAAGVSRTTLAHRFREHLGSTVNHEIARQRLWRAKSLLLETNMSVEEVGRLSGFRRPNYFNSFFSKQTGTSPGLWRSHHKGTDDMSSETMYGANR